jgi:hypothetical protein
MCVDAASLEWFADAKAHKPKPSNKVPGITYMLAGATQRSDSDPNFYTGTYDDNFLPGGPYPSIPFKFNESFKTWHGDGTEFENAFLPPTGNNICYGVWKDLGDGCVKLHHIGLMFSPEGILLAIFTVDETDTVSSNGNTYRGMFDFKVWPPSYEAVGVGTPISEVRGTTLASRITVD